MSDSGTKEHDPITPEEQDDHGDEGGRHTSGDEDEGLKSSSEQEEKHVDVGKPERDEAKTSQVYTAEDTLLPKKDPSMRTHALILDWSFGINYALPIFNLQDRDQLVILYASAHVGVIYNHTSTSQHLLQGHGGPISCVCMSEDRRWLVTADNGREPLVIIWDSYTGIPVHTLFHCHSEGSVTALAFSKDAKYMATLGAGEPQCVCIWNWTNEPDIPMCVAELNPEHGFQNYIIFNPGDSTELLSNSESQVLFYKTTEGNLEYIAPDLHDKSFNQSVGSLSQSLFHWRGQQALTATSAGNLVLWDVVEEDNAAGRGAIKLLCLQKDAITVLTSTDRWIVTGDVLGHIKFYDENFQLMSWYSALSLDAIASISFSKDTTPETSQDSPKSCTLEAQPFVTRSFVVSTVSATVVHVKTRGGAPQTLLREHCAPLHAVACHPRWPVVAMGSQSGVLKLCDYNSNLTLASRVYESEKIQCLTFDPQGLDVAVGFASGAVHILDACSLHSEDCFHVSSNSITHITFSMDSMYLATADTGNAVTVFHLQSTPGSTTQRWQHVGRHLSHYKPIRELLFGVHLDSTRPRLLSLGMDRRLVEYDLDRSTEQRLVVLSAERVEQSAVPQCMTWYPPLTTEHFLLIASDQHKMKLLNSTTNMCRKTLLAPTYESPVQKMVVLPGSKDSYYLAFITEDKVGLQILPLDGNPYKSIAVICHHRVSQLACSFDGRFLFTSGGADCTVLRWEINLDGLQAAASLGGSHLDPFYALLEGERGGAVCREMEDFFYYCQLRHQGLDSMATRQVSSCVPLTEVPFLMRALGFFPTEQELEDMQNEVKFSKYAETGKYVTDVDLAEFLKLYINHRPAFGIASEELAESFRVLGVWDGTGQPVIPRYQLLELLQARGEHMREDEVVECFSVLSGEHMREDASENHAHNEEYALDCVIPDPISAETFASHILGFPLCTETRDKSSPSE